MLSVLYKRLTNVNNLNALPKLAPEVFTLAFASEIKLPGGEPLGFVITG